MSYYVYILRNIDNFLYIGQTNNLEKRVKEHCKYLEKASKFTKKHENFKLVYKEEFLTRKEAIKREKQLKNWRREWKLALIRKSNPKFRDLYPELIGSNSKLDSKSDPESSSG